eukprot:GEMP01001193.1.p1 GENE.GEMP01001193.1~~GEMP01001193.1.p1  ORF type:complete len:1602 (-),score=332.59 GEMP01001193.1:544-5349(-)
MYSTGVANHGPYRRPARPPRKRTCDEFRHAHGGSTEAVLRGGFYESTNQYGPEVMDLWGTVTRSMSLPHRPHACRASARDFRNHSIGKHGISAPPLLHPHTVSTSRPNATHHRTAHTGDRPSEPMADNHHVPTHMSCSRQPRIARGGPVTPPSYDHRAPGNWTTVDQFSPLYFPPSTILSPPQRSAQDDHLARFTSPVRQLPPHRTPSPISSLPPHRCITNLHIPVHAQNRTDARIMDAASIRDWSHPHNAHARAHIAPLERAARRTHQISRSANAAEVDGGVHGYAPRGVLRDPNSSPAQIAQNCPPGPRSLTPVSLVPLPCPHEGELRPAIEGRTREAMYNEAPRSHAHGTNSPPPCQQLHYHYARGASEHQYHRKILSIAPYRDAPFQPADRVPAAAARQLSPELGSSFCPDVGALTTAGTTNSIAENASAVPPTSVNFGSTYFPALPPGSTEHGSFRALPSASTAHGNFRALRPATEARGPSSILPPGPSDRVSSIISPSVAYRSSSPTMQPYGAGREPFRAPHPEAHEADREGRAEAGTSEAPTTAHKFESSVTSVSSPESTRRPSLDGTSSSVRSSAKSGGGSKRRPAASTRRAPDTHPSRDGTNSSVRSAADSGDGPSARPAASTRHAPHTHPPPDGTNSSVRSSANSGDGPSARPTANTCHALHADERSVRCSEPMYRQSGTRQKTVLRKDSAQHRSQLSSQHARNKCSVRYSAPPDQHTERTKSVTSEALHRQSSQRCKTGSRIRVPSKVEDERSTTITRVTMQTRKLSSSEFRKSKGGQGESQREPGQSRDSRLMSLVASESRESQEYAHPKDWSAASSSRSTSAPDTVSQQYVRPPETFRRSKGGQGESQKEPSRGSPSRLALAPANRGPQRDSHRTEATPEQVPQSWRHTSAFNASRNAPPEMVSSRAPPPPWTSVGTPVQYRPWNSPRTSEGSRADKLMALPECITAKDGAFEDKPTSEGEGSLWQHESTRDARAGDQPKMEQLQQPMAAPTISAPFQSKTICTHISKRHVRCHPMAQMVTPQQPCATRQHPPPFQSSTEFLQPEGAPSDPHRARAVSQRASSWNGSATAEQMPQESEGGQQMAQESRMSLLPDQSWVATTQGASRESTGYMTVSARRQTSQSRWSGVTFADPAQRSQQSETRRGASVKRASLTNSVPVPISRATAAPIAPAASGVQPIAQPPRQALPSAAHHSHHFHPANAAVHRHAPATVSTRNYLTDPAYGSASMDPTQHYPPWPQVFSPPTQVAETNSSSHITDEDGCPTVMNRGFCDSMCCPEPRAVAFPAEERRPTWQPSMYVEDQTYAGAYWDQCNNDGDLRSRPGVLDVPGDDYSYAPYDDGVYSPDYRDADDWSVAAEYDPSMSAAPYAHYNECLFTPLWQCPNSPPPQAVDDYGAEYPISPPPRVPPPSIHWASPQASYASAPSKDPSSHSSSAYLATRGALYGNPRSVPDGGKVGAPYGNPSSVYAANTGGSPYKNPSSVPGGYACGALYENPSRADAANEGGAPCGDPRSVHGGGKGGPLYGDPRSAPPTNTPYGHHRDTPFAQPTAVEADGYFSATLTYTSACPSIDQVGQDTYSGAGPSYSYAS